MIEQFGDFDDDMSLLVKRAIPHLRCLGLIDPDINLYHRTFQTVLSQGQWPLLTRPVLASE